MRLHRARFKNWCQFKDLTIEFSEGLNAIRGPNGSGKTNCLNGIVFALTGDFSRNPGVKADNIYQLASDKEKSWVEVELSHAGVHATLIRNLRPSGQSLKIKGEEKPWTRADEITNQLISILGVNEKLLHDYIFVNQWQIFDFISQKDSVRAKAFGELFNAEKAEIIYRTLGEYKIDVPTPSIDGDRVRIRLARDKAEAERIARQLLHEYGDVLDGWTRESDPSYNTVMAYAKFKRLKQQQEDLDAKLVQVSEAIDKITADIAGKEQELAAVKELVAATKAQADQAKSELSVWQVFEMTDKAKNVIESQIAELKAEKYKLKLPHQPEDYIPPSELTAKEQEAAEYRNKIQVANELLETFNKEGICKCPTCGTPIDELEPRLKEVRETCNVYKSSLLRLTESINRSKIWKEAWDKTVARINAIEVLINDKYSNLKQLAEIPKPTGDKASLEQLVKDFQAVEREVGIKERDLRMMQNELSRLQGQAITYRAQIEQIGLDMNDISVTEAEAIAAERHLQETGKRVSEKMSLCLQLKMLERSIKDDEAALLRFQEDERNAGKLRQLSKHLEEVREIFKQLPSVAVQVCLESMWKEIDEVLEQFDAPFRIHSINNLKFVLKKHSGVVVPAERLSGGEKAVFALAFRIVVNARFAGQLGLLCLDEPTAGLDEDNLGCLEIALGRLRELSNSRGLQVILITHESGIDGLFDKVICLHAQK
jgi:DNA repair exonuclease SbcCD ATPase subunit